MGDGIQNKYALIINGDGEARHLENVDRAVATLKEEGGFNINVVGQGSSADKSVAYISPTKQNLDKVVAGFSQMDNDDLLVVYVTGHGGEGDEKEGTIIFPDGEYSLKTFSQKLEQFPYGNRIFVMDQCFSGNSVEYFIDDKTTMLTAGSPGEVVSCGLFAPQFWADDVPDGNLDGVVTIRERYAHTLLESPQFVSLAQYYSPLGELSLSGDPSSKAPFDSAVLDVESPGELDNLLATLQPGQLALVTFSADWCMPCQSYKETFDALATQYAGNILMIRMEGKNGSEKGWDEKYGLAGFPTVAFFDDKRTMTMVPMELSNTPLALLKDTAILTLDEKIAHLKRMLASGDAVERVENFSILKSLLKQNSRLWREFPEEITACLQDDSPVIRHQTMTFLNEANIPSAVEHQIWPLVVARMDDADDLTTCLAIDFVGKHPEHQAETVPLLEKKLESPSEFVRLAAADALLTLKTDDKAWPVIMKLLSDNGVADQAAEILQKHMTEERSNKAFSELIPFLESPEYIVREAALEVLKRTRIANRKSAEELEEALLKLLDHETDTEVMTDGIKLLSRVATEKSYSRLMAFLNHTNFEVSLAAAKALKRFPDHAEEVVSAMLASSKFEGIPGETIEWAEALADYGPLAREAIPRIANYLDKFSGSHQASLAVVLWKIGDKPTARSYFKKALQGSDTGFAMSALRAIMKLGPEGTELTDDIVRFLKNWKSDPFDDAETWVAAIRALGAIGPGAKKAIPLLEELTESKQGYVAQYARSALYRISNPKLDEE